MNDEQIPLALDRLVLAAILGKQSTNKEVAYVSLCFFLFGLGRFRTIPPKGG